MSDTRFAPDWSPEDSIEFAGKHAVSQEIEAGKVWRFKADLTGKPDARVHYRILREASQDDTSRASSQNFFVDGQTLEVPAPAARYVYFALFGADGSEITCAAADGDRLLCQSAIR